MPILHILPNGDPPAVVDAVPLKVFEVLRKVMVESLGGVRVPLAKSLCSADGIRDNFAQPDPNPPPPNLPNQGGDHYLGEPLVHQSLSKSVVVD